jgi:predicted negative regulator of RcsB-dependent stress response
MPAVAIAVGAYIGAKIFDSVSSSKAQKESLSMQNQMLKLQTEEIARQRKIEEERQRRENMELMNSVSNLTNTSYGGTASPSVAFDKYGDMG